MNCLLKLQGFQCCVPFDIHCQPLTRLSLKALSVQFRDCHLQQGTARAREGRLTKQQSDLLLNTIVERGQERTSLLLPSELSVSLQVPNCKLPEISFTSISILRLAKKLTECP